MKNMKEPINLNGTDYYTKRCFREVCNRARR